MSIQDVALTGFCFLGFELAEAVTLPCTGDFFAVLF
jgi:hypothetical protein